MVSLYFKFQKMSGTTSNSLSVSITQQLLLEGSIRDLGSPSRYHLGMGPSTNLFSYAKAQIGLNEIDHEPNLDSDVSSTNDYPIILDGRQ
jgi:hypothetical protein